MPSALTADMESAFARGLAVPTLEIVIGSRTFRVAEQDHMSELGGQYVKKVVQGGWGAITRDTGDRSNSLQGQTVAIKTHDEDREILNHLDTVGEIIGSSASIVCRAVGPAKGATPYSVFIGQVDDYPGSGREINWILKPSEGLLDSDNNIPRVTARDFPDAPDASLGQEINAIYGNQISQGLRGIQTGMIQAISIGNNQWLCSYGKVRTVPKVWRNDVDETNDYPLTHIQRNRHWYSVITHTPATDAEDDTILFDCEGFETNGDGSSGTAITNPLDIIEHYLVNFVFGAWDVTTAGGADRDGWLSRTTSQINTTAFDFTKTFFDNRNVKAARVVTSSTKSRALLNEFCKEFRCNPFWASDWKLAVKPHNIHKLDIRDVVGTIRSDTQGRVKQLVKRQIVKSSRFTDITVNYQLVHQSGELLEQGQSLDGRRTPRNATTRNLLWGNRDV